MGQSGDQGNNSELKYETESDTQSFSVPAKID